MKPEDHLHHFSPYLPTDRFRALLRNSTLPSDSEGAALMVDISGFTPMTMRFVTEYGPERASEELKRRLNPMFEAIAGQVFHHGGSVIRFTGDGFIAWFDDHPLGQDPIAQVSALLRAVAAGLEMQAVMPLFKGLRLKVCIGAGVAHRWVVGHPQFGLIDVLLGPAAEAMLSLAGEAQPGQVMVYRDMVAPLRDESVQLEIEDTGNAVIRKMPEIISKEARRHRWPAWSVDGDVNVILNSVRPFVDPAIRERVESGLGDFVAELRDALPMFIQIKGVSPEQPDAQERLDTQVRLAQSIITSFGGRLVSAEVGDKGSVLFAVFGAPLSYGDDAERAIRAAMALREMSSGPDGLSIERIGLSRGQLYAGTIGGEVRHEYSNIGDETNIASRLMSAASYKQILTTSKVRNEVGPRIAFRELTPLYVKGREEPISVTEPVSVRSGTAPQVHAGELVGRENELNQLHKAVKAVRKGYPRIVRVEGQPGIGKSRLVAELVRLATDEDFQAVGGDCVSTGRGIPYLPWRDLLFSLLALQPDADMNDNMERLQRFVEQANPEWLLRVPLLGDVLQLPIEESPTTAILEGRTRYQALFALVIDLLYYLAHSQPLMLIIEDTQWIDEVSEALVVELARRLMVEPIPLLVMLVHRPLSEAENLYPLISVLAASHIHTNLVLDELNRSAVTELLENYLKASIPPELSRFVYDRTHGNPFFIQEVIDTLLETGHIKVIGSLVFIERDLQSANLPQTVQKLVQARIDRLSEMDKLVLKVAAVIGHEFQVRVLAKSIPVQMSYDDLLDHLRILEERDFSYQETPDPELTYLFKHAITQEVTYQSLLFAQRKQLHYAVGSALEVMAPDASERLAYHFSRSDDHERARHYLLLAGEKAYREYANHAALGHFTQALELATDDNLRYQIGTRRMEIMLRLGDMQHVKQELPALQAIAERSQRLDWQVAVHIFWASYYTQTSTWHQVIGETQQAISAAQQIHDESLTDELIWEAYLLLRGAFVAINQREEAELVSHFMEPVVERLNDPRRRVELQLLQIEDSYSTNPQPALTAAQNAHGKAAALQNTLLEAASLSLLATLYSRENNLIDALLVYKDELELHRQVGNRRHEGLTLFNIGRLLVSLGELSAGNSHLLDAYNILRQIGERSGEAASLVYLGVIAYHHKAYDEALAYMNRGLALQRTLNNEADVARTLFYMANTLIMKTSFDEAAALLNEAQTLFEANNLNQHIGELRTAYADIELCYGNIDAAQANIEPLLPRLEQQHIADLMMPGLAYWRTVHVLDHLARTYSEPDSESIWRRQANKLRSVFRSQAQITLQRLSIERREAFINSLWYHAELLNESQANNS